MGRSRVALAVAVVVVVAVGLALAYAGGVLGAGGPAPGSTAELTLPMSDGVTLACSVTYPEDVENGTLPGGGHAGVILFPGFGQTHDDLLSTAQLFAGDGYEALACDTRGTGASGGTFGFDGKRDVQDAQELLTWLSGQLGNDEIGAFGLSLGGAEVWSAATAGVPFKAIVPGATWTDLGRALVHDGVFDDGVGTELADAAPAAAWDPSLAQVRADLLAGSDSAAVQSFAASRSSRFGLHALATPTLILQARHDLSFDLDQALAAYRRLQGPHFLYLGDLDSTDQASYLKLASTFFDKYLKGMAVGTPPKIQLGHDPWDGLVTPFPSTPPTRPESVTLPGTTALARGRSITRSAFLTGGPLETFGDGTVVVRYSGASGWTHLVATVSVQGQPAPVTVGAAPVTKPAGLLRIPLMDELVFLPRGKRIAVTVDGTSDAGGFTQDVPAGATISVGRVTLNLPLLRIAVSR